MAIITNCASNVKFIKVSQSKAHHKSSVVNLPVANDGRHFPPIDTIIPHEEEKEITHTVCSL